MMDVLMDPASPNKVICPHILCACGDMSFSGSQCIDRNFFNYAQNKRRTTSG